MDATARLGEARAEERRGAYARVLELLDEVPELDGEAAGEWTWLRARATWKLGRDREAAEIASRLADEAARTGLGLALARACAVLARLALIEGRLDRTSALLDRAFAAQPDELVRIDCEITRAGVDAYRGSETMAEERLARAVSDAEVLGEPQPLALGHMTIAWLVFRMGRAAEAREGYERARAVYEGCGDLGGVASALDMLARVLEHAGDGAGALRMAREAVELARRAGNTRCEVSAMGAVGQMLLRRGEADEAERWLREAIALERERGGFGRVQFLLLRAQLLAGREGWADARLAYEDVIAAVAGEGQILTHAAAEALILPCVAGVGDLPAFDRHCGHAAALLREYPIPRPEIAAACERAADLVDPARAARALAIGLDALDRAGDAEGRDRVAGRLRGLRARGAPVPLDRFELLEPVGAGGMGQVWGAVDRDTGAPAAIKVLTAAVARRPDRIAEFEREVRAAAALTHEAVAPILAYGRVDAAAAAMAGGALIAGSPWFAMARAAGTLEPWCGRLPWDAVRAVLLELLDALALAHARGIVHRDLKPANVLVRDAGRPADGIWLADFGLATTGESSSAGIAGTPPYMAPEQLEGRWLDYGPWTDLYATGCLTMALVAGEPPGADRSWQHLRAERRRPLALPTPRIGVPEGFGDWIARLVAPETEDRFARAAHAASALRELGEPHALPVSVHVVASAPDTFVWEGALPEVGAPAPRRPASVMHGPPPDWRGRPPPVRQPTESLWGLRPPPLVGRDGERDRLWDALQSATNGPWCVVVTGAAGVGRSRLSAWIAERAHELGVTVPVLVRDDAHDEADWREVVATLDRGAPGLTVLTARDDVVAARPELATALATAEGDARVARIALEPLSEADTRALVAALLPLDAQLSERLVARCAGNPQFAIQLVGDWVARRLLRHGPDGYTLRPGTRVELPTDLAQAWTRRLETLSAALGARGLVALEVAAALGARVDSAEWARACAAGGHAPSDAVAERLIAAGLAEARPGGWRFADPSLRDFLLARGRAEGRASAHHLACLDALSDVDDPERVGLHALAAGRPDRAFELLIVAAERGSPSSGVLEAAARALDAAGAPATDPRWEDLRRLRDDGRVGDV